MSGTEVRHCFDLKSMPVYLLYLLTTCIKMIKIPSAKSSS
jgi:hypothetical protein